MPRPCEEMAGAYSLVVLSDISSQFNRLRTRPLLPLILGRFRPEEVHMRDGEPGWFYVGNGQLRNKDSAGSADPHQDIEDPAKTSDAGLVR
jgi:hypothetical protein